MLNERIRKLRLAKGLTLQQVGDVFGISAASVSSWEKGINFPDGRKLKKLADTLGVSVNALVNSESGDPNDNSFNVPFFAWSSISNWPDMSQVVSDVATLLHHSSSKQIFATRYSGNELTRTATQLPLPGSIVFIDTSRALNFGSVVLVLIDGEPHLANCTRSEKGTKKISTLDLAEEYSKESEYSYIGTAIEWQISGIIN